MWGILHTKGKHTPCLSSVQYMYMYCPVLSIGHCEKHVHSSRCGLTEGRDGWLGTSPHLYRGINHCKMYMFTIRTCTWINIHCGAVKHYDMHCIYTLHVHCNVANNQGFWKRNCMCFPCRKLGGVMRACECCSTWAMLRSIWQEMERCVYSSSVCILSRIYTVPVTSSFTNTWVSHSYIPPHMLHTYIYVHGDQLKTWTILKPSDSLKLGEIISKQAQCFRK